MSPIKDVSVFQLYFDLDFGEMQTSKSIVQEQVLNDNLNIFDLGYGKGNGVSYEYFKLDKFLTGTLVTDKGMGKVYEEVF